MLNDAVIKAVIATTDSGCRQGELRRLHWSDLQGNTLRVTKQSLEVVGALVNGKFGPDGRLGHPVWAEYSFTIGMLLLQSRSGVARSIYTTHCFADLFFPLLVFLVD